MAPSASNTDATIILSETSQKEKDTLPHDITYTWNLKWDTNKLLWKRDRFTGIASRLVGIKREKLEGGMDWQVMASRCNLLYTEWISNKVLLYSTENYVQYPVTSHNGKEYEKRKFPGGPVVRTLCFYCWRPGFNPWSGNNIPQAVRHCQKWKRIHTHTHTHTHTQWITLLYTRN